MGLAKHPGELGEADRKLGHVHNFSHQEIRDNLEKGGFRIREMKGMLTKSLPNAYLHQCNDIQLKGLFDLGTELPIDYAALIYCLAEK